MKQAENREFRRQSLLSAAMATVARFDIQGATVARICDEAGASRGLIAHYFDSKESLLLAALENWFHQALEVKVAIAKDDSLMAEQKIRAISLSSFQAPVYSWENAAAWQAFTNASRHHQSYAKAIRSASENVRKIMEKLFRQAEKEAGIKVDPEFSAKAIYALEDGLYNSLATGKDDFSIQDARCACELFIDGFFNSNRRLPNLLTVTERG